MIIFRKKNRIKAAIIYLSGSTAHDIANIKISLQLLEANFNNRFHYPIIIFHEDFDENLIQDIRKQIRSSIRFEKVKFELPDNIGQPNNQIYLGYRHMCRFFSGIIFRQHVLKDYDWYWRLDTDSFLLGKIKYDIFRYMEERDYAHGFIAMVADNPAFVEGLWDITKKYIVEKGIRPTFLHKFMQDGAWDRRLFNTHFEIIKLDFWRSKKYMEYFDYIDRAGGIYKYRWGDHAIHFLALSMFMPEKKIYRVDNIAYMHQTFVNLPNNILKKLSKNLFCLVKNAAKHCLK